MNIELKPIAESKVRQLGGDVCGVLVRKNGRLAAVDEHGRVQWLQSGQGVEPDVEAIVAALRTCSSIAEAESVVRAQMNLTHLHSGEQGGGWVIQLRDGYLLTRGIWERADHCGYTNDIHEAGRYSEEEARKSETMAPDKYKAVCLTHHRTNQPDSKQGGGDEAVSVNDRLPAVGHRVLAWERYSDFPFVGYVDHSGNWQAEIENYETDGDANPISNVLTEGVTHWMELPQPPKSKED